MNVLRRSISPPHSQEITAEHAFSILVRTQHASGEIATHDHLDLEGLQDYYGMRFSTNTKDQAVLAKMTYWFSI